MVAGMKLNPPNNQTPEAFLYEYDSTPQWPPEWPRSRRMAVVCVYEVGEGENTETIGVVITSQDELRKMADPHRRRLFFKVPRSIFFDYGGQPVEFNGQPLCPGLTLNSFED